MFVLFFTAPFKIGGKRATDLFSPGKWQDERPRELRFRAMFNEYQVGYFNKVAEDFEAIHPDVDVVIERVTGGSWTDFEIALINDFWSGHAPDVARISDITLARLIAAGMLAEAPPEVVANLDKQIISDKLKDVLRRGDKTYGTIHAATWQGIYYNKD
ncbi:MAG: extracellular solute-binding protein, partial [bacterium]